MKPKKVSLATRAIHGKKLYPYKGAVTTPIYQTSTYRFENSNDAVRYSQGDPSVYVYSRYHNPSVEDVEEKIAEMYDAEAALLFSSGMAAISTAILSIVKAGDEIISTPALYGGTYRFFRDVLPLYNVNVTYVNADSLSDISKLVTAKTKLFFCESPTNPTIGLVDLHTAIAEVKKAERKTGRKIATIIDNTFASCLHQAPFTIGFDLVVESATKYIGGHSDLLAGAVIGSKKEIKQIRQIAKYLGGCADPFAAFLLSQHYEHAEDDIRKLQQSSKRAYNFLENILDWSVYEMEVITYVPEKVNVLALAMECLDLFKSALSDKGLTGETAIPADLFVAADTRMVKTILRNLISNAIKYSFKKGSIIVSAEALGDHVEIAVIDFGKGVGNPDEILVQEVQPSERGTASERGSGLGLYIVKDFLERHGSSLKVKSNIGLGSIFSFTLHNA
ncbi:MAG: aminotransferase class I/II-fold pyridoxal phosphate-dependent enzyme [Bacteroidota bacterium]